MLFAACVRAGPVAEPFLPHIDGAANLAGLLHDSAVRLRESSSSGDGELSWDYALQERTFALVERARIADEALSAVWAVVRADELTTLAELAVKWGEAGSEVLRSLAIEAEAGKRMMTGLTKRFREHDAALEEALAAASKDTVSLLLGPLVALEKIPEGFHRLWRLSSAFGTVGTNPESPWETTTAFKAIGFAVAGEMTRTLASDNPFRAAWTPLSTLITTLQTIIDLGNATGELASMKLLLDSTREVQAEYGAKMRFYDANEGTITMALRIFDQMAMASQTVDSVLAEAHVKIDAIDADSFYWSV